MPADEDDLGPDPTSQALIRLVPTFGPLVATWRQETYERKQRRTEKLGAAAAEEIGAEQFFTQVASDERLTDMFNAAVDSAIATSSEAKIRLLGRALAASIVAPDEAKIDEAEQLLRISLELEPVDLRALRSLERWRASDAVRTVGYALGIRSAVAGAIVARLERLHLIRVERLASVVDKRDLDDDQVSIDEEWAVTETAEALMDLLRQHPDGSDHGAVRSAGAPWAGFTEAQAQALEYLADLGDIQWRQQPRTDLAVAKTLRRLDILGLSYARVRAAMRSIGFSERDLNALDRWVAL